MSRNVGNRRGLANGNGLANGTPKDARSGAAPSRGLTNGLGSGLTNGIGKGFANGNGAPKGLANGMCKGLTNGNGLAQGSGLTNGLGRTNGLAGAGRANGLTNGMGALPGLTNGMGCTNGLTNGLGRTSGLPGQHKFNMLGIQDIMRKRFSVFLVIILVVTLAVSYVVLLPPPTPAKFVDIDGAFGDWGSKVVYSDTTAATDASLDIVDFSVATEKEVVYGYLKTRGNLQYKDAIERYLLFVDSDKTDTTGYIAGDIGADYVIEAYGWRSSPWTVQASRFSGSDQRNWSAFRTIGTGMGRSSGSELEFAANVGAVINPGNYYARFATASENATGEICTPKVDGDNGALVVTQAPLDSAGIVSANNLLALTLRASGKDVTVNGMRIASSGVAETSVSGLTAGMQVRAGTSASMTVTADMSNIVLGTLVRASVATVSSSGSASVAGYGLAAYAQGAPANIAIDGAFADWGGVPKYTENAVACPNPDIDVTEHAATTSQGNFYAYVGFSPSGQVFGGMVSPVKRVRSAGGGGSGTVTPGAAVLPRTAGEDLTRIYIDAVPGGQWISGVQADYCLEVKGTGGKITSRQLLSYPGMGPIGVAQAGSGAHQLEAGVPFSMIGNPSGNASIYIETTDWTQRKDTTTFQPVVGAVRGGTRGVLDPSWGDETTNTAVCTAVNAQSDPQLVPDGQGGTIMTWSDNRSGTFNHIYAQRANATGSPQWTSNGIAICTATGSQYNPTLIPDGQGGAIITWHDGRNGYYDIYAQLVNATGVINWTLDGIAICTATDTQYYPKIIPDGQGGAIITWGDNHLGFWNIYTQRVNASGLTQWIVNGVATCNDANGQYNPNLIPDGQGGAIITWQDIRNGNHDIYAQHVNATGIAQWAANGIIICTATNNQYYPKIISDGQGGAIITWEDYRAGVINNDIYAQRVSVLGAIQWTENGTAICTAVNGQYNPQLVPDGQGGAIIAWEDWRGNGDIYAQRVNATGVMQWTDNGTGICTAVNLQGYQRIVPDGQGGAIITWEDFRNGGNSDIYAQRVNINGVPLWAENEISVSTASGNQRIPRITIDNRWLSGNQQAQSPEQSKTANELKGIIILWLDQRNSATTDWDIYAQAIIEDGKEFVESHSLHPDWGDAATNTAVSTATGNQQASAAVPDGQGGAIVAWQDLRAGNVDIYAQRMTAGGQALWTAGGVAICTEGSDQLLPVLVCDGQGGAIIAWMDLRGDGEIYAQRVNATGEVLWAANGAAVCTAPNDQNTPQIVPDGQGGAIIAWDDWRNGVNYSVFAQRANSSGAMLWTADGVPVGDADNDQYSQQAVQDGQGGAIIVWEDYRSDPANAISDIYAQRVDPSGSSQWTANGMPVCAQSDTQFSPRVLQDGAGGAIIAWQDTRGGGSHAFAQRIDSSGAANWTADGIQVCANPGNQYYPELSPDGKGGAIVVWQDGRDGTNSVFAQNIDGEGNVLVPSGIGICDATGNQERPQAVPDGDGGALIAFNDATNGRICLQHINSTGAIEWDAAGMPLLVTSSPVDTSYTPQVVIDGQGGAIVLWHDLRNTLDYDLYAQRVSLTQSTVVINEAMFDPTSGDDWFEIYNPAAVTYDISGWKLIDGTDLAVYTYPAATALIAGGYSKVDAGSSLGADDYLALVDANGTIRDFVAWGTSEPSGAYYQLAVNSSNWPGGAGRYVDTTGFVQGNTIGRDMSSNDTNAKADWEITCGINADQPTPNARNIGSIPEFQAMALPIVLIVVPLAIAWRRRRGRP
ncbi:MAG: lamin tail domain-containing protein [Euryarchaeota archaeon]|nr:lamin tail domain-containing protein [Euryarchaeota archaeon]